MRFSLTSRVAISGMEQPKTGTTTSPAQLKVALVFFCSRMMGHHTTLTRKTVLFSYFVKGIVGNVLLFLRN